MNNNNYRNFNENSNVNDKYYENSYGEYRHSKGASDMGFRRPEDNENYNSKGYKHGSSKERNFSGSYNKSRGDKGIKTYCSYRSNEDFREGKFKRREVFDSTYKKNDLSTSANQLYISNLPENIKEWELVKLFNSFGNVLRILIKPHFSFVEFEKYEDAIDSIMFMDGLLLLGKRLMVSHSYGVKRKDSQAFIKVSDIKIFPNNPSENDICFNCNKFGHWANHCNVVVDNDGTAKGPRQCFNCGAYGHTIKNCNKAGNNYKGKNNINLDKNRSKNSSGQNNFNSLNNVNHSAKVFTQNEKTEVKENDDWSDEDKNKKLPISSIIRENIEKNKNSQINKEVKVEGENSNSSTNMTQIKDDKEDTGKNDANKYESESETNNSSSMRKFSGKSNKSFSQINEKDFEKKGDETIHKQDEEFQNKSKTYLNTYKSKGCYNNLPLNSDKGNFVAKKPYVWNNEPNTSGFQDNRFNMKNGFKRKVNFNKTGNTGNNGNSDFDYRRRFNKSNNEQESVNQSSQGNSNVNDSPLKKNTNKFFTMNKRKNENYNFQYKSVNKGNYLNSQNNNNGTGYYGKKFY